MALSSILEDIKYLNLKLNLIWTFLEAKLNFWKKVSGCYERHPDTQNSIRMQKESIRIRWGRGIRMLKEASGYKEKASGYFATGFEEQRTTEIKSLTKTH